MENPLTAQEVDQLRAERDRFRRELGEVRDDFAAYRRQESKHGDELIVTKVNEAARQWFWGRFKWIASFALLIVPLSCWLGISRFEDLVEYAVELSLQKRIAVFERRSSEVLNQIDERRDEVADISADSKSKLSTVNSKIAELEQAYERENSRIAAHASLSESLASDLEKLQAAHGSLGVNIEELAAQQENFRILASLDSDKIVEIAKAMNELKNDGKLLLELKTTVDRLLNKDAKLSAQVAQHESWLRAMQLGGVPPIRADSARPDRISSPPRAGRVSPVLPESTRPAPISSPPRTGSARPGTERDASTPPASGAGRSAAAAISETTGDSLPPSASERVYVPLQPGGAPSSSSGSHEIE